MRPWDELDILLRPKVPCAGTASILVFYPSGVVPEFPMSRFVAAFAAVGFLLAGLGCAEAAVVITVDKSSQRLTVAIDGAERYEWPVSTARWGYSTPNGTYRPERLARKWYSRKYDWSPMPHSIFFHGGYAIHGSYEIRHLGRPASHGCIRLLPKNAAVLFKIVQANRGDTTIVVTGERPSHRAVARQTRRVETSARRHRERVTERRARRYRSDFDDVFFGLSPGYGHRRARYPTWGRLEHNRNPGQRVLRGWWYSR